MCHAATAPLHLPKLLPALTVRAVAKNHQWKTEGGAVRMSRAVKTSQPSGEPEEQCLQTEQLPAVQKGSRHSSDSGGPASVEAVKSGFTVQDPHSKSFINCRHVPED